MSNYDPNAAAPGFSANGATAIDVGLRSFMLRVYNYMAAGVGLTGVAAFLTYQFTGPELLQSPLMWVLCWRRWDWCSSSVPESTRCRWKLREDCFSSMRPW